MGGGNNILNEISKHMGRHRDDIILVLDEIHMACKNNEKIADQLKTFLDEGGEFPHVIGITTEDEFEKYVKDNQAFSLRFDRVNIRNTNKDETLKILSEIILKQPSIPLVENNVLESIYEVSNRSFHSPQPASSIKLVKQCLNKIERTQKSASERKIYEMKNKIDSLRAIEAITHRRKEETNIEIAQLEKEIGELSEQIKKEQSNISHLFKSKEILDKVHLQIYKSILKISKINFNKNSQSELNRFVLLNDFIEPILKSYIQTKANELNIKIVIDDELVHEVANPS